MIYGLTTLLVILAVPAERGRGVEVWGGITVQSVLYIGHGADVEGNCDALTSQNLLVWGQMVIGEQQSVKEYYRIERVQKYSISAQKYDGRSYSVPYSSAAFGRV